VKSKQDKLKELGLKLVTDDYKPKFPKPAKKVKKKRPSKAKVPEKVIQSQVENYLRVLGVRPIRLPDSLFRAIYANQSVSLGVKSQIANSIAGLPDLIIPKITDKGTLILPLELKAKGGVIGPKQRKWEKELGTVYAYSFEEAKEVIDNFLKDYSLE